MLSGNVKLIMIIVSFTLVTLSAVTFIINMKLQEASITTWIAGLVFIISCILLKMCLQLDHPKARTSFLISCMLVVMNGISASRSYLQYRIIKNFNACSSTSYFRTSTPFNFQDYILHGTGDGNFFYNSAMCLTNTATDDGGVVECSCYSHREKDCYSFGTNCYFIYYDIPNKLMLISNLSIASLSLAIVMFFAAGVAIKSTIVEVINPVQADATTVDQDMNQHFPNADNPHFPRSHTKVINIDQATPVDFDDETTSQGFVTVQGYATEPIDVKTAYRV